MAPQIKSYLENKTPFENYPVSINGYQIDSNNRVAIRVEKDPVNSLAVINIEIAVTNDLSQVDGFLNQFKSDLGL